MNRNLLRDPVDDLCDAIARLQFRPADAALIYRALGDYRANNTHTHMATHGAWTPDEKRLAPKTY